tara:strand:- start:2 stop:301 length:300 start_codon:yes stop_codon:yes gene_type:complete
MEQKLFDVLLENRKIEEDDDKLIVAFRNIEEGFAMPMDKSDENKDTSIEAQAERQFQELYSIVLQRFTPEELDYVFNILIPQEKKELENEDMLAKGYVI